MNKFLRVLGLGLMIATFAFAGFAQEPTRESVYKKYTDNFEGPEATKLQMAIDAAKEYIAKFNTDDDAAQVTYFKEAIPTLEQAIAKAGEGKVAKDEYDAWYTQLKNVVTTFNQANTSKNWTEAYNVGKQAIDKQFKYLDKGPLSSETVKGQKLDIAIGLAAMGFDRAVEKDDTFNNDATTYLKSAIQQLEAGQAAKTTFGKAVGYDLESKDNALGLLNYYLGYIMYYRQKKEPEALPYLYKSTQTKSSSQDISDIYRVIGFNYYNKLAELDKDRLAKIEANNKEDNSETLALLAQEKGYADRGVDAYARALKIAMNNPKATQDYKTGLRASLEELYKFRYDKTDGVDAYLSNIMSKPFPNPATPIQPVVEQTTTTTTTTSTTTPTTPSTKPTTTMTTKTTETKTTKPMANGAKTTVKTTTTEAKTPPKKPRKR
ncbi:MAG: hypothetical protein ABIP06_03375 [Pyrinomonadaceae bacterium]